MVDRGLNLQGYEAVKISAGIFSVDFDEQIESVKTLGHVPFSELRMTGQARTLDLDGVEDLGFYLGCGSNQRCLDRLHG
jgi:hypothetical protein